MVLGRNDSMDFYRRSTGLGSTELKKAIERNRLKRLQRQGGDEAPQQARGEWGGGNTRESPYRPATLSRLQSLAGKQKPSAPLASRLRHTEAPPPQERMPSSTPLPLTSLHEPKGKWYQKILIACGWLLCCLLLGRLIFANRGVIHYYSQENFILQKVYQNQLVREENQTLSKEIKKIRKDPSYQRKLVRQHLGMITKDEYLIVFSKENSSP